MKLFKTVYGVTIHQYILQQRIEMARQLLIDTDEPIKAIAVNTGFSNEKYFITMFKKKFLITPGVYRRQNKV
ncbi:MAG: helix-turn-helix transcriptional regulator [Chitinophagaceae bacterium]|nr:helix-turn-helix transcriptional regulator [Chitinophagaceae bacterium]